MTGFCFFKDCGSQSEFLVCRTYKGVKYMLSTCAKHEEHAIEIFDLLNIEEDLKHETSEF